MLEKLKSYGWQLVAMLLLIMFAWCYVHRLSDAAKHATEQSKLVRQLEADARTFAQLERAARSLGEFYRTLEGNHRADIEKINTTASAALANANDGAARAHAAKQRLQSDLADYITAHREAAIARAASGECTADTSTLYLLADLQRRADDRAGELAHIADTARARGAACEQSYDSAEAMTMKAAAHVETQ